MTRSQLGSIRLSEEEPLGLRDIEVENAFRAGSRFGPDRAATEVCILGSATNTTNVDLAVNWGSLGLNAVLLDAPAAQSQLGEGAIAVGRLDVLPTLDGVEAGMLALLWLERRGLRVLNPAKALLTVHDKLRTARRLGLAGLPHPRTVGWRGERKVRLELPFVVKPRFGSWGEDVLLCRNAEDLERVAQAVSTRRWFRRHGALLQELIPPRGWDLRVIVAGTQVVGASRRTAAPGEWRTNVSLGGSLRPVDPTIEAQTLAIAAASAVGVDLVGVDLMPLDHGGYTVVELNGAVEFDKGYSLPGRNVYVDAAAAMGLRSG